MAKRRKSPRKNLGKQLDFYRNDGDEDIPDITSRDRKDAAKVPSRYRYRIGYKEPKNKPLAWARNEYNKLSSESSYEEESESESEEKGLVKDISKKKTTMMVVTRLEGGSQGGRNNEDEDTMTLGMIKVVLNMQSQTSEREYLKIPEIITIAMKTVTVRDHG